MKYVRAIGLAALTALLAAYLEIPKTLGAHPWWSTEVIQIGAAIGLLGGLGLIVLSRVSTHWAIVATLGTAVGYGVAKYGQTQFAASYAEDAFAGQLWFFGWHATCAFAIATVLLWSHTLLSKYLR